MLVLGVFIALQLPLLQHSGMDLLTEKTSQGNIRVDTELAEMKMDAGQDKLAELGSHAVACLAADASRIKA